MVLVLGRRGEMVYGAVSANKQTSHSVLDVHLSCFMHVELGSLDHTTTTTRPTLGALKDYFISSSSSGH